MSATQSVTDGRVDILGQARVTGGRAIGEVFVDLPNGSGITTVVEQMPDGAIRVRVLNRGSAPLEVFVGDDRVYESVPF